MLWYCYSKSILLFFIFFSFCIHQPKGLLTTLQMGREILNFRCEVRRERHFSGGSHISSKSSNPFFHISLPSPAGLSLSLFLPPCLSPSVCLLPSLLLLFKLQLLAAPSVPLHPRSLSLSHSSQSVEQIKEGLISSSDDDDSFSPFFFAPLFTCTPIFSLKLFLFPVISIYPTTTRSKGRGRERQRESFSYR